MNNVREIVNGAQLNGFINKKISITGFVVEKAPNGMWFDLKAADDQIVRVALKRPIDKPLEGCVEVHGTSSGKGVLADEFIIFDNSQFDAAGHNTLCKFLYSVPNIWNTA